MPQHIALDADFIMSNLDTVRMGRKVIVYKSTSSTNDIAAEYAKAGRKNNGLAIFAEQQTAGRGRRANKWLSQAGKSILCSVLVYDAEISANMITIASAVAVAQAIGKCGNFEAKIKWPNDILLNDKKVAGILVEKQNCFIIGIGINCHQQQKDFAGELYDIATSVDIQSGAACDRNRIAKRLLVSLDNVLSQTKNNPDDIIERWKSRSILLGRQITVETDGSQFTGNCIGVEPTEGLIIQLQRGGVKIFNAASTTIIQNGLKK